MVLADTVDSDVTYEHKFVVVRLESGDEVLAWVLSETRENLGVHARHTRRRCAKTFAFGVLPDCREDLPDGRFDPRQVH
jgi:hypothetical protein